jgi:large repetitive protein
MFSFNPFQWAKSLFRGRVKTIVKRPRYRLLLEELESRLAPATYTWTGGGGSANPGWATAANWGGTAINPNQQIDLVFSTPTSYASNNNLTGLNINSITFNASNFLLTGNQITLGNPATSGSGFVIVQSGLVGENIALNMQLAGAGTSSQFFTIHAGATLTVSGQISGTTGSQLTVQGGGTVILSGNNNGYVGPFTINNDQSTVKAENSNALGGVKTSTVETLTLNNPGLSPATTFTLSFGGLQTGSITYTGTSADAAAVQTALNALTTIQNGGGGSVLVYQTNTSSSETFVITFSGTYTGTNVTTPVTTTITAGAGSFAAPIIVAGGAATPYVVTVGNTSQLQLIAPTDLTGTTTTGSSTVTAITSTATLEPGMAVVGAGIPAGATIQSILSSTSILLSANATASGAGIDLSFPLTLANTVHLFGAGAANTGALMNVAGTNTWSGSVVLENIGTNPNYINVKTPVAPNLSQLTISGVVSDAGSGGSMTKIGGGTLILANANTYRGSTYIQNGILDIENPLALGAVPSAGTFTQFNAVSGEQGTLQLQFVDPGYPTVPANSQYYILANPSQPYSAANSYVGFVVPNYSLFLLGPGYGSTATLDNVAGDNAWSGHITLETDVANGASTVLIDTQSSGSSPKIDQTQLVITGVIGDQDSANPATLTKANLGQGNLVLEPTVHTASVDLGSSYRLALLPGGFESLVEFGGTGTANTYVGGTDISAANAGTVTIVDSQALGLANKTAMTIVGGGSSLNLVSNVGHIDSLTSTNNRLLVDSPLTLNGPGYQINGQDEGALHSISGINTYGPNAIYNAANPTVPFIITVADPTSTIGVEPDPSETSNKNYFTNDYSLTITGGLGNTPPANPGAVGLFMTKLGAGQLILPNANNYFFGAWDINQGWVTVEDPLSLGGQISGVDPNIAQGAYFTTTVDSGAALMLRPLHPNTNFTLKTNLILEGNGISHAYPLINQMGAVENLEGANTLAGNVTFIGQVGIGVEQIDPTILSSLTSTGELNQAQSPALYNSVAPPTTINVPNTFAAGGKSQYTQIVDTGSTQGSLVINYNDFDAVNGDNLRVYYGPIGTPGSALIYNTTLMGSGTTAAINFGPGNGTQIEIVIDNGVVPAGSPAWSYNGIVTVSAGYFTGGLIKLGSQQLLLEGGGTFQGGVDIRSGIVVVANNSALGTPLNTGAPGLSFGTTVEAGAALVLSPSASSSTGQSTGLSIWGNHLTLSGTGNAQFGDAPLTVSAADNLWSGPITLSADYAITYQNNLGNRALPTTPITANFRTSTGDTTLTGTAPTVTATTTTPGAPGLNDIETLTFGGAIGGGTFTLTVWDGAAFFTTGDITWSGDPTTLIQAIQAALNFDPLLVGNFMVSLISPIIDVAPNARLNATGNIDDGTSAASPLIHSYALSGGSASYSDMIGSVPITPVGGTLSSSGYSWANVTGANQGLTLPATALGDPNNYTIQMDFSLTTVNPASNGTGYVRVINYDVTPQTSGDADNGLYTKQDGGTGAFLVAYPSGTAGPNDTVQNGVPLDLIVTRDSATGNVQAYINGVAQFLPFGFDDSVAFPGGHEFVPQGSLLEFFIDDLAIPDEVSAGNCTSVKIYDRSLNASEVSVVAAGGTLSGSSTLPADLIVAGGGSLQLNGTNAYHGTTYVNQGTVTVSNGQALGTSPGTGQQTISLTNAVPGVTQFQLAFGSGAGSQTGPITYTGTAADATAIQAALQGLSTIGANNAEVIQENPGVFLVTFPNAPLSGSTDLISPTIVSGTGVTGTTIVAGLWGGTEVANNSQLQLQGGITVAGEPLTLQGSGGNLEPTEQTFTVGTSTTSGGFSGAYTLNFNNAAALTLVGNTTINSATVTGLSSTAQLAVGMQVSGSGIPAGTTILAINSASSITLSANATATGSPTLTFTIQLAYNASAAQIQAYLQSLSTVGNQGGQISVNVQSVNPGANDTQSFFVPNAATSATNFGLSFGSGIANNTGNIFSVTNPYSPTNYFSNAIQIGNALDALPSIGGASVGGSVTVSGTFATVGGIAGVLYSVTFIGGLGNRALASLVIPTSGLGAPSGPGASGIAMQSHTPGAAPSITYQAIFQGAFSGVNQPLLTVPSVSGNTTVSTPALKLAGGTTNSTPDQWFSNSQGTGTISTAITNAQSYFGTTNAENASGPVTSVAVDPSDASVIYVATAGGGAWRTEDGGQSWQPLFDSQFAGSNPAVLFGGAIAIDPQHVNIIYYGTGNANISGFGFGVADSYYGAGVYESQDFGQTWTLLIDTTASTNTTVSTSPGNPLYGLAVSKIAVLDATGATPGAIAVAASDVNPGNGIDVNGLAGNAGVWLYNRGQWTNTTTGKTPTGGLAFPSVNGNYVDVFFDGSTLFTSVFAGGTSGGQTGVYSAPNFLTTPANAEAWTVTDSFPIGTVDETKLAGDPTVVGGALYASEAAAGAFAQIQVDTTPGTGSWANTGGQPSDYLNPISGYANAIYLDHTTGDLYVGGTDQVAGGTPGTNFLLQSTDQGGTWTDIVNGVATGPQTSIHSIVTDSSGNVFVGTDGGVWKYDITTSTWTDLTGNLANSQFVSVATDPNNPNIILAGGHSVGIDLYTLGAVGQAVLTGDGVSSVNILNGDSGYFQGSPPSVTFVGGGGSGATGTAVVSPAGVVTSIIVDSPGSGYSSAPRVIIAPSGVQTWTQVAGGGNNIIPGNGTQSDGGQVAFDPLNPGIAYYQEAGTLAISTDNGVTWTDATTPYGSPPPQYAPFDISPSNPSVLVGGQLSTASGVGQYTGFLSGAPSDLNAPAGFVATSLGVANFQGAYQNDPAFPNLTVFAANHADTSTVYITDGTQVDVTKNLGVNWATNRGPTATQLAGTTITKIIVDPADRDTAFVVTSGASTIPGTGHVFETTNAGQSWTDISAGLPNLSVWAITVDPRTNDIYVGNDIGIYKLAGGAGIWQKFGAGLPNVMVTDIDINTNANVLTIATYGRGAWQFYLDDTQANAGALRALGGNDIWTGPITLEGATTISANGSQNLQNGFSGAELTLLGTISDSTSNALGNTLTKIGGGDVVLSGTNTYAGVTIVQQGNIVVTNPSALGAATTAGSQLLSFNNMVPGISQYQLSFGSGAGSQTATLLYTGVPATDAATLQAALQGLTTIGANNAIVTPANSGAFLITFPNAPLASSTQLVNASIVTGLNGSFLGSASTAIAGATVVTNGAALELQSNLDLEPITLNGNGIQPPYNGHFTGALVNVSNFNTYTGTITLNTNSTIGVTAGQLTISSATTNGIVDGGNGYSLNKEGNGTLDLASPDTYSGGTSVTAGALQIQNSQALGPVSSFTTVTDGAQLQLQASAAPTLTSATLTSGGSLALNIPYYYVVTAVNATGDESVLSNQLSAMPLASGTQAVTLTWSPVEGAVSYRVYRSMTSGKFTNTLLTTVAAPGFTDLGLSTMPGTPLGLNVGQHLYLGGAGILNDGALRNVAGNNTWSGAITLAAAPNFSPASSTAGVVAIYVESSSTLTFAGHVNEGPPPAQSSAPAPVGTASTGLTEIGAGTLILANSNSYTGGTYVGYIFGASNANGATAPATVSSGGVNGGVIDVQNSAALGANQSNEIQRITTYDPPGANDTFSLSFNGQSTTNLAFGAPAVEVAGPTLSTVVTQAGGSLTAGTTYYYVVTSIVNGVESMASNEKNTGIIAANKTAKLTWVAVSGATYNVYRATATGAYSASSRMNSTPLPVGLTTFIDDGTLAQVAGAPPVPVQDALNSLSTISPNGGSVSVTRDSLYTGLDEVQTLSLTNPTSGLNVPTNLTASLPSVANGGNLTASTTYYYQISAITPLGESIPTAQASATTTNAAGNNLTINLAWTAVPGATSYKIYRSTSSGRFIQAYLTTVTTNSYVDAGSSAALTAPTFNPLTASSITVGGTITTGTYHYVITSIGPAGESAISTAVTATIPASLSGYAEVQLAWTAVAGATGYRIYRATVTNYTNSLIAIIPSSATTTFTDVNTVSPSFTPVVQTQYTLQFGSNTVLTGTTTNNNASVTLANTYQLSVGMQITGTGIAAGAIIQTINDSTHITMSKNATVSGTSSLSFIPTTQTITYTGVGGTGAGSDAAAIQTALSALKAVGTGNVVVTPDATDTVFTITFTGTLSDSPQALISAVVIQGTAGAGVTETTPGDGGITYIYTVTFDGGPLARTAQPLIVPTVNSAAMTVGVTEAATGSIGVLIYNGAALQVDGDPNENGAPAVVVPGTQIIALNGNGPDGAGALVNVSGANSVQGNIILQSNSTLGANANSQMTLTGLIQDAPLPTSNAVPTSAPASVTKVGAGSVVLAPAAQTLTLANAVSPLNVPTMGAVSYSPGGSISTTYFYEVSVIGPNGESLPGTPKSTAINGLTNQIANLNWTNPLGASASGYRIYRSTASTGPFVLLANIDSGTTLTYADTGSTPLLGGSPQLQTRFTLSIGGHVTSQIAFSGLSALASTIQSSLQTVLSANYPGVTASVQAANASTYTVTYSGTPSALGAVPSLTGAIVTGRPGSVTINTNTFAGDVYDNAGLINIQSAQALGVTTSAVQEISVSGSSGTFSLTFNGSTTGALQYGVRASGAASPTASIENALNALPSINATYPYGVSVTQVGNNYYVYFNGQGFANRYQNPITYSILSPGISSITITQPLAGGATNVDVASGATLQTQSNYVPQAFSEASGKYLTIAGLGANNVGALENVSGANAWGATPITLGTNPAAIGNADTGAIFSLNQPITDSFLTPTIQFSGFVNNDTYTLSYGGAVTAQLTYTGNNATDLATIQNALASLSSVVPLGGAVLQGTTTTDSPLITGLASTAQLQIGMAVLGVGIPAGLTIQAIDSVNNTVTLSGTGVGVVAGTPTLTFTPVIVVSPAANQFNVTFTNTLYGTFVPGIGSVPVTSAAGTFVTPVGPATSNGNGVNKVGLGTVQYNVANSYTGATNVVAGQLQLNNTTGAGFAVNGPLVIGDTTPVAQVQTLTLGSVAHPFAQLDQFTLTYGSSTTTNITYYQNPTYEAAAIQTALNAVLGANFVSVTATSATTFLVTLNGLTGPYPLPNTVITGANLTSGLAPVASSINPTPVPAPFAPNSAIVQLLASTLPTSGQINPASAVTVNSDGLYDLNNFNQTDASLTINVGTTQTGTGALTVTGALIINDGALNVQSSGGSVTANGPVTMTGGSINLAAGCTFNLNADLTATSDATGPSLITGPGTVQEGAATRTFTVIHGASAAPTTTSDLIDTAVINGGAGVGLTKTGAGRLEITVQETYPGTTTINQGDVQVDAVATTTQVITLVGAIGGTTKVTLSYLGNAAPGSTFTYTGTTATDVNSVQAALIALGIPAGNIVSVTGNGPLDTVFSIVFNTAFAPIMPAITSDPTANAPIGTNAFVTTTAAAADNLGNVVLNGASASLSGTGFVGGIAGNGTINPGINTTTPKAGIVTVNSNVTLTTNDTFFVDLANPSGTHPNPIAGADYDQLSVNGTVNLGGAMLAGSVGASVQATPVGDNFTILQASGGVTGQFTGDLGGTIGTVTDHVFLGGQKFLVTYNTNSVVLTHVLESLSSFTMTSSPNPSVYGQTVTFTITAVPEAGASFATGTPTFTITETPVTPIAGPPVVLTVAVPVSGIYVYTPPSSVLLNSGTSTFTVSAAFNDPNVYFDYPPTSPFPATITQTVNQNTVDVSLSPSTPPTPVYGQQIQFTGTATPHTPLDVTGAQQPTGNIEYTIDPAGLDQVTNVPLSGGSATFTIAPTTPLLGAGAHTLAYQYVGISPANVGDPNYTAGSLLTQTFTIAKDNSLIAFTPASTSSTIGQSAVINVLVTPNLVGSIGVPTGTVDFYDGVPDLINHTNRLNTSPQTLVNGAVSFSTSSLIIGSHTIYAVYSGDTNYIGHTSSEPFTVNLAPTATSFISANPSAPNYGDQINFTFKTVENPNIGPSYNPLVGNITVWADATSSGTITATTGAGVNPIVITSPSNGLTTGQTVSIFGVTGDTAANGTFTVTTIDSDHFSIVATGNGTYTGGGTWVRGGSNLGTAAINSVTGQATVLSPAYPNALSQGSHTITGFFNSTNPNFAGSNASISGFVVGAAATHIASVTGNPTSSTYGSSVTFTATVTTAIGTLPVTGDINSSVTFVDTTTGTILGTGFLLANNTASITTNVLNANTNPGHTITATYNDTLPNAQYSSSSGSLTGYHVAQAPTTVTVPTVSPASGTYTYGATGGVTFHATASSSVGPLPVGAGSIISFYNGTAVPANFLGSGQINSSGVATYTTTPFQLNAGLRTITAVYSDALDNNFANSAAASLTNYSVLQAATSISVGASPSSGDIFGQSVTFTATVSVIGSSTATVPDAVNDVKFVDTTTGTILGYGSTTGGTGIATLTTNALTANTTSGHTITATYTDPASNLATVSNTVTAYHVAKADTSVALATSAPPPGGVAIGQNVTFTATVTNISSGSTIPVNNTTAPGSTVTFKNATTGTTIGTVPVNASGVATLTMSFTTPSSSSGYTITAQYNIGGTISPNFNASTIDSGSSVTQFVRKASTTSVTTSAPLPTGALFGQTVNFTVTVTGSGGTPQGDVSVSIDGGSPISVGSLNSSGHLTYSTSTLTVGTHSLVFTYAGDATTNFAASSATISQTVRAATTTALTSNFPGGSNYGQAVTFTATVTAVGAGNPGVGMGTVTFKDTTTGVTLASNVALNAAGQAIYTTSTSQVLSVTSHTITATYSGYSPSSGATYAAGTPGSMVQVVSKAVTNVSSPTSSLAGGSSFGQTVTFTVVVSAASGGRPPTSGASVTFKDGSTVLGNGTLFSQTLTTNTYRYITTATQLGAGTHSITATYNSPSTSPFASSAPSPAFSQVVNLATTQTVLSWTQSPTSNYWSIGTPLTFKAKVTPTSAGTPGVPTGSVQFDIDGVQTVVALVNGVATMPAPTTFGGSPPTNSHTVTVTYIPATVPNQNFADSNSTVTKNVLLQTALAIASSAAGTSPVYGTSITFTATLSTTALGGPPTGPVYIIIDGVSYLGTLVSSSPTLVKYKYTTTALTAGTHTISAHYNGDANFNPADPTANLTQSITARVGRST